MYFGWLGFTNSLRLMLSTAITIIPAIVNLIPAKRIWEAMSFPDIPNILYPILMQLNADPHKKQQNIAIRIITGVFDKDLCFIALPRNCYLP